MKQSFWAYFLIIMGIAFMVIMLLIQRISTATEEDFYLGREVMEAAMIDAVDYGTYRTTGKLVMSEQKFVEVFIRRFAESVTNNKEYELSFYDIYEEPPKASVRIRTTSGTSEINSDTFEVKLDVLMSGILETIYGTSGEERESSVKKIKRYIVCTGAKTFNSNQVLIDDAEGGKLVTLSYNSDLYNESEGINEACKYNLDNILNPTINQKYCKVNYEGKTVYVLRGSLANSNPKCNVRTLVYNLENKSKDCKDNLIVNYNSKWGTLCTPSRSGYKFSGWYTESGGKGTKVDGSEKARTDLQVYAMWTPDKSELTFNNNGGSGCTKTTVDTEKAVGTLCTPSKAGSVFKGWTNCDNKSELINSSTKVYGNMNLCAIWETAKYTLKFDSNGGTACAEKSLPYNSNYDLSCNITKSGNAFDGWYTAKSGGTKVSTSNKITQDTTVYAHWKGNCSVSNPSGCPVKTSCKTSPSESTAVWSRVKDGYMGVVFGDISFYVVDDQNYGDKAYIIIKSDPRNLFPYNRYYYLDIPSKDRGYISKGCIMNDSGECTGTCQG